MHIVLVSLLSSYIFLFPCFSIGARRVPEDILKSISSNESELNNNKIKRIWRFRLQISGTDRSANQLCGFDNFWL